MMVSAKSIVEFIIKVVQLKPTLAQVTKEYQESLEQAKEETLSLKQALRALNVTPVAELKQKAEALQQAFARLETAYKKGEIATEDYAAAQRQLRLKISELQPKTKTLSDSFAEVRKHLLGLAAASYSLVKAFGVYSTFETHMAEVNTLLDTSQEEFNRLRQSILSLSTQIPQSASELASAEYDIISAGVKLKDSVEVLNLAAKAAIAGLTDTKTAAKVGLSVINAYGMSINNLKDVYDTLFMTVKLGVTTFGELAQYIGMVLPVAKSAGVSFTDLSAAIATLTKAGIRTPQAIEYLRGALTALTSPTEQAKKQMEALGITWKGLIPTIKEITKYANDPNIMRNLVPDVQARVAVLALANNFQQLNDTVAEFQNRAGVMPAAYEKVSNTPDQKLELFKNQIEVLTIKMGELLSDALLPVITQINKFLQAIEQVNGPTRAYIEVLMGAGAAFGLWKAGLGAVITGIGDLIGQIHSSTPVMEAFKSEVTATNAVLAGAFVATTALAVHNVMQLAKEVTSLNSVLEENQRLANQYEAQAEKFKSAANVQILSQEEVLKLTDEQRKAYEQELLAAMKYYTYKANAARMEATQAKKILGIPLPFQSEKAKEAQKNAEKFDATLQQIITAFHQLKAVGHTSIVDINKSMQALHPTFVLSRADAQALGKELQKAYQEASKAAEDWKNKVIAYQAQIRQEHQSTEDLIRSLRRQTMSEEEAWYDKKMEAEEKLAEAERALHEGNYEQAKKYAEQAKQLYSELATTVYETTENGQKQVVLSLKETSDVAISGIQQASSVITEILEQQKKHAQDMQATYEKKMETIQHLMDELTKPQQKEIRLDVKEYDKVKAALDELAIPVTKYIHVEYVKDTPEKHAIGGRIPGYGGGDIVPALLEPGEFVVRKEAVRRYEPLLHAINNLQLSKDFFAKALRFKYGGSVGGWSFSISEKKDDELKYIAYYMGQAVNLLGDKNTEMARVGAKLRAITIVGGGLWNESSFEKAFSIWWKRQRELHKDEIKQALMQDISEKERKIGGLIGNTNISGSSLEEAEANLNILLGSKSFPVKANKSIINELLAEIEKLKALGYA